ncbi:hypothetical protein Pfo_015265, partial [Paulownia fortunei]
STEPTATTAKPPATSPILAAQLHPITHRATQLQPIAPLLLQSQRTIYSRLHHQSFANSVSPLFFVAAATPPNLSKTQCRRPPLTNPPYKFPSPPSIGQTCCRHTLFPRLGSCRHPPPSQSNLHPPLSTSHF